jgi:phosphomannomutase
MAREDRLGLHGPGRRGAGGGGRDHHGRTRRAAVAAAAALTSFADVDFVPLLPTPTATWAVRAGWADAALLITASHNSAEWNGVKLKVRPGTPPDAAIETEIETRRDEPAHLVPGSVRRPPAAPYLTAHLDAMGGRRGRRVRVLVDGVHGVAGPALAAGCRRLGWQVCETRTDPRPDFGAAVPDPVRTSTRDHAATLVRERGAELALLTDGDGDRLILLDAAGHLVMPHHCAAELIRESSAAAGTVAVTVSTGTVVRQVCEAAGGRVVERPIGFKHIAPLLADGTAGAGVGAVGDLAFADLSADRDPLAVLVRLAGRLDRGGAVADWTPALDAAHGVTAWREVHLRFELPAADLRRCAETALAGAGLLRLVDDVDETDGAKYRFGTEWLLVRASTTEGGTRVFSEMRDRRRQEELLGRLAAALEHASSGRTITTGQEGG